MESVLTVEQVGQRYSAEWVLLADPKVDGKGRVVAGKVVAHSKDRDEVYRRANRAQAQGFGDALHGQDSPRHSDHLVTYPFDSEQGLVLVGTRIEGPVGIAHLVLALEHRGNFHPDQR